MNVTIKLLKVMAAVLFVTVIGVFIKTQDASAQTVDTTLKISDLKGYAGDIVEVPVKISHPQKGIAAYGIELNYDTSSLEVVDIEGSYGSKHSAACSQDKSGCFWSSFDNHKGYLRTAWADTTAGDHPIKENTTLFTIKLAIKNTSKLGSTLLTVDENNKESLNFTDANHHLLDVKVENGHLNISKSSNADLSSLQISDGRLTPSFSKDINKYAASVENTVHSISFVPKTADEHSKIFINGKTVTSEALTGSYPLAVGKNSYTVDVQAQDGTEKKYTVTVNREKAKAEASPAGQTQIIHAAIESNQDEAFLKTPIYRTAVPQGYKDIVTLNPDTIQQMIKHSAESGSDVAKVVIPDTQDKVLETYFTISKAAMDILNQQPINLQIITHNVQIEIPKESLKDFNKELYFRIVPVKEQKQQGEIKSRAAHEEMVQKIASGKTLNILGRPMKIETNMENRKAALVLPLSKKQIDELEKKDKQLEFLHVFIEHGDGTKELMDGKIGKYSDESHVGLKFTIHKFSTFSPIYVTDASEKTDNGSGKNTNINPPSHTGDHSSSAGKQVSSDTRELHHNVNSKVHTLPKTGDDSFIDTYLNIGIGVIIAAIFVTFWFYRRNKQVKSE